MISFTPTHSKNKKRK